MRGGMPVRSVVKGTGDNKDLVQSAIQFVRTGSFTAIFQDKESLSRLTELAGRADTLGKQSRAILAEIYDQVGMYESAGDLATHDIGKGEIEASPFPMS